MKFLLKIFSPVCILPFLSCSPVKGYEGNDLPPTSISLVRFLGNAPERQKTIVNGISLGMNDRIVVLPGTQTVSFNYWFYTYDNNPTEDTDRSLGVTGKNSGACGISFSTEAGAEYGLVTTIQESGKYSSEPKVMVRVSEKDPVTNAFSKVIAEAPCSDSGRGVGVIF